MLCFSNGSQSHIVTEWAACGLCIKSSHRTETRYAQIEKELLAIVFACNQFNVYIYGRDVVRVETDHQPLESIVRKPLNDAPKLQPPSPGPSSNT